MLLQGAPPTHGNIDEQGKSSYSQARKFTELPLSEYTKEGLKASNFVQLTAIQRCALPQALCGRDVFGAAKTGSGKTLAFLVPVSPFAPQAANHKICLHSPGLDAKLIQCLLCLSIALVHGGMTYVPACILWHSCMRILSQAQEYR